MPLGALYPTYSGLVAFQRKTNVTANNIANAHTDGFKKSRAALSTIQPQGVTATAEPVEQVEASEAITAERTKHSQQQVEESNEESNVDIGEEMVNLLAGQRAYEANVRALEATDEMVGSLLDIIDDER